jgi:hypothetical protein
VASSCEHGDENLGKIKEGEMGRAFRTHGEMRNAYKIFIGKPEGKRPLGKPRRIWEGNIKMHFRELWLKCADWIHLSQERNRWRVLVNAVMNTHSGSIKGGEFVDKLSDY